MAGLEPEVKLPPRDVRRKAGVLEATEFIFVCVASGMAATAVRLMLIGER